MITFCGLYSPANATANPSQRASTMIHEAWHSHNRNNRYRSHGECTDGRPCDEYFPHTKMAFAEGHWYESGPSGPFAVGAYYPMGSYQAQHEFACDLADYPSGWVPASVRREADVVAANRSDEFHDIPFVPFSCGPATPYGGQMPAPDRYDQVYPCGNGGTSCSSHADCPYLSQCEIPAGQTTGCCGAAIPH